MTKEDYYKKKAVSNSSLDYILPERGGSIKKYASFLEYPEKFPAFDSDAIELGKLMHDYIENPSAFSILKADFPGEKVKHVIDGLYGDGSGKLEPISALGKEIITFAKQVNMGNGKWDDARIIDDVTKNGSAYYQTLIDNPGARFVDTEMYNKISSMILSLSDCQILHDPGFLLGPGWTSYEELAIEFKTHTGVECKSLIDKLFLHTDGRAIILDYKTISSPISFYEGFTTVNGDVEPPLYLKRHVHRQLGFYAGAVAAEFKLKLEDMRFAILAQETNYPFEWRLIDIPKVYVEEGISIANHALSLIITSFSEEASL